MSNAAATAPVITPTIWQELEGWSASFAGWQKLLLATAVRNVTIPVAVLEQAYSLFLSEHDLAPEPTPKPEIPLSITGREKLSGTRRRISRIYSPVGVNRLPASSELAFADGLTVIYGGNGVGKSGFARILSNACFSRQQHPIYPNVFDENAPVSATAMIDLVDAKGVVSSLPFTASAEHKELKVGFVVFDSAVANRHLTEKSPLGFVPTGFDVFAEMARAYSILQGKLAVAIDARRRPNMLANVFLGPDTPASLLAVGLSRFTDLTQLEALASFGPDQGARIEQLQVQLDQLRTQSPDGEIKRLADARPQLLALARQFDSARMALSEDSLASDAHLRRALAVAATAFATQSADQFKHDKIQGIGSPPWEQMVVGSQTLLSHQHEHYPSAGDVCLLCQQELGDPAKTLYAKYVEFVSGAASTALARANAKIEERKAEIQNLSVALADTGSIAYSFLETSYPVVLAAITDAAKNIQKLQSSAFAALSGADEVQAVALPDLKGSIGEIVATIDADLVRLRQSDVPSTLLAIEQERIQLRHREVLAQNKSAAVAFVSDLKWIFRAEEHARALNPRHLTDKQQELFSTVIAKNYRDALAKECEGLACDVPVELRTQGRQGQTLRSLQVGDRSPEDILSEGEQRAVALADFFTEVGLNDGNVGIILDDPVTSLDHDRQERIAIRLVTAAADRQVIIFTHDLVFFAKLTDAADKAGIDILSHWMQRSADNVPGTVSANDSPTTTPQYRKTDFAEDSLAMAKVAVGSAQEKLVRQGAGQLRRTIEEIVPQFLFKEVVRRWTDRVMVTSLRKINWDNALADAIVEIFEACSAMMEGHSHTEAGAGVPPTPGKLEELIVRTKELIRQTRVNRS